MSALLLKQNADYLVHDSYTVETEDHEDHTFNGVMFDVEVLDRRPVQALVVDSIHVRGGLGQMSVWCVEGGRRGVEEKPNAWTRAFSRHVNASWRDFTSLKLEPPLILLPGKTYGLYVHSADQGDDGVVYDNQRDEICHEDDYIRVFPGLAHLSPDPFGADGPWWGSPWRRRRAFVGKLSYGARYVLWRPVPAAHTRFDPTFRKGVVAAFYALTMGWGGSARCGNLVDGVEVDAMFYTGLPTDCVLYILHLARYDWFEPPQSSDTQETLPPPPPSPATAHRLLASQQQRYANDYSRFDNIRDSDDSSDSSDDDFHLATMT